MKTLVGLLSVNSFRIFALFKKKNPNVEPVFYIPSYLDVSTKSKLKRICKYEFESKYIELDRNSDFCSFQAEKNLGNDFECLFLYGTNHFEVKVLVETYKSSNVVIYEDGTLTYCEGILSSIPRVNQVYLSNYIGVISSPDLNEQSNVELITLNNKNLSFKPFKQSFVSVDEYSITKDKKIVLIVDSFYSAVPNVISEDEEIMMLYQLYGFLNNLNLTPLIKWHPRRQLKESSAVFEMNAVPSMYNFEEFIAHAGDNVEFVIGNVSTSMLSALHYFNVPSIVTDNALLFEKRIEKRKILEKAIRKEIALYYDIFPKLSSLMRYHGTCSFSKQYLNGIITSNLANLTCR